MRLLRPNLANYELFYKAPPCIQVIKLLLTIIPWPNESVTL